jgi:glyoxylase-like metal-dependent hydrolase (beta-lactamase superfamily II)
VLITSFPAGPLAANCYVLAAHDDGPAVVIDPGQHADVGLERVLGQHRLSPAAVLLTHGHLDHVACARALFARLDIPAYVGAADEYMLADPLSALSPELRAGMTELLAPGEDVTGMRPDRVVALGAETVLKLAGLTVEALPVPGHTGGSVTYRVPLETAGGLGGSDAPEALLTGDTLFAGSIGRTDLPGGSSSEIVESIRASLLTRPDASLVLPGHGPASTIGAERTGNPYLAY